MLKKILSSLATLTLVAGSVTTTTAWTEHKNHNSGDAQKQNSHSSQNYNLRGGELNSFTKNTSIQDDDINQIYSYNNVIYVGTLSYGLWESIDNGVTFTQNKSVLNNVSVSSIIAYDNILYLGTSNGLWESIDNGVTFTQNTSIPINTRITKIVTYNNVIYVGTFYEGLWESNNFGKWFWDAAGTSYIPNIYAYNNIIYVGKSDGLYESFNNGKTFTKNKSLPNSIDIISIYAYNDVVYVLTGFQGLYESKDNQTFTKNTSIPNTTAIESNQIYAYNNVVYVSTTYLYESNDNGQTFTKNTSIPNNYDNQEYELYGLNSVVYVSYQNQLETNAGLYESSDNGKTFNKNTSVPGYDTVWTFYSYNNILYFGGTDGLYESKFYATVNEPNQIINSYNDLLYANPINFNFDWTLLSQVKITDNSSKTPTTKTLTSGSYQIKDDGNYTVTFSLKNGDTITNTFFLKNGYDFSQGINAATWDPTTSYLDIYLNQAVVNNIINNWINHFAREDLLSYINRIKLWNELFTNKRLKDWMASTFNKSIFENLDDHILTQ